MRFLFERVKTVAEPSGACALAALLAGRVRDVRGCASASSSRAATCTRRAVRGARSSAVASGHGLERPDPRRGLRRAVRGPQARALAAAARRQGDRRQRRQLHALHAAAAGRRRRHAGAAPRRRAAARAPDADRPAARPGHRRRPRPQRGLRDHRGGRRAHARRTTSDRRARLDLAARCRSPACKEHAVGFKTLSDAIALRNQIVQTLERAESVEDEAARRALLTYVFVGAGYAGLEGLAELQDFAADVVDLYPRSRVAGPALHPRRGARPRDARDLRGARRVRHLRAAPARDRGADVDDRRADLGRLGRAVRRRGGAVPDRRVDGRRAARARWSRSWAAARRRRADRGRPLLPGRGARRTCGRSATRPRCPIPPGPASRRRRPASTRCARAARWRATWPPRWAPAGRSRSPTRRSACSSTWATRRRWPRPRHQVARLPRLVPGPHVPPGDDAGHQAQDPAGRGLDGRPRCSAATRPSSASSGTRRCSRCRPPAARARGRRRWPAERGRRRARAGLRGPARVLELARRRRARQPRGGGGGAAHRRHRLRAGGGR